MDWRRWVEPDAGFVFIDEGSNEVIKRNLSEVGKESINGHETAISTIELETWTSDNLQIHSSRGSKPENMTKNSSSVPLLEQSKHHDYNLGNPPIFEPEMATLSETEVGQDKAKVDSSRPSSDSQTSESVSQGSKFIAEAALSTARGSSHQFVQRQKVKAKYFNGSWYPATISEVKGDGIFYVVEWEDGDPIDRLKCVDEVWLFIRLHRFFSANFANFRFEPLMIERTILIRIRDMVTHISN